MDKLAVTIHFAPLLPMFWLGIAIGVACMALAFALWKNRSGIILRCILTAAFIIALFNPSIIEEQREAVKDVAFAVIDQSPSQKLGQRTERTQAARAWLEQEMKKFPDTELRIIEAEPGSTARETRLFSALDKAIADVPAGRRAGAVFLSDGQIHDIPKNTAAAMQYGPLSLWISGDPDEKDRQLVITQAPAYGISGQTVQMKYKIVDTQNIREKTAAVTINQYGQQPELAVVTPGEEQTVNLKIEHAGQNVFELSAQTVDGELTPLNNRAALIVNGVRDRLRVLLVSGQPHAGGRTWRDLLTSDPGVDLVHFTILRDPEKLDMTPQNELSLIAFPFQELFEEKLYDFDLIIFDQYKLNRVLPDYYFANIVKYVEQGGALLEASGPGFATEDSVYNTDLSSILPGAPTGEVIRKAYKPMLTEDGTKHPVTANLEGRNTDPANPGWSDWLRQVVLERHSGDVLMKGADGLPLLILDRVKEGRVAQLASDHIWLWSRGYGNGGPHAELLRRIVHWAMKEPELDEKALSAEAHGDLITIRSRNYKQPDKTVRMVRPDNSAATITLKESPDGFLQENIKAETLGIYSFEDADGQKAYAVAGDLNPPELSGVRATPDLMHPLIRETGGGLAWMGKNPHPDIRFQSEGRFFAGRDDILFRKNNAFDVKGVEERPLLPAPFLAIALLALMMFSWWREGRSG
jgi:hypothetical protein